MDDLTRLLAQWPVEAAAAGVTTGSQTLATGGAVGWPVRTASVSKLFVGMAALVAIEEGAIALDEPAGPPGATVEHLLAHASGLALDTDRVLAAPAARRIYSNTGIETFAAHLAAHTGMSFEEYLQQAVLEPLQLRNTHLAGSPAHGVVSTLGDLLQFARELLRPTLISPATLTEATTARFPDLAGVVPGLGRFDPNPWGLAFELRGHKSPHWTATGNSPATFGHFGATGTFLWVDPIAGLGCAALTGHQFGEWARVSWPIFSDEVLARYGAA